ncbi:XkdQ/YqbQ family protein [Clostridium oryzae]|uniref:Phage late control protein Gpd n=1 Tax=Clostridium oryzae TaxID=1450648 RepID=A0A1V4IFJ7_9CLOT|nr:hypothetical protein [Clostridium oryzae]OPJ58435.1 phage late control protein Gpd [Clostridium oryzae]
MIEIFNYNKNKTINVTKLCESVSISGSKSEVARKLEIKLLYSILDKNHDRYAVPLGSKISVKYNGKEIFKGVVWQREFSSSNELSVTAYDYLIYILKSKVTRNVKNTTAEKAVESICSELGVSIGKLASPGVVVKKLIISQQTGYEAIMALYKQAAKSTGKKYMIVFEDGKLRVIQKGTHIENFEIRPDTNIISTTYNDTLDNMINKVKIYNDKKKYTGEVYREDWKKKFGLLQENYVKEDGVNAKAAAKNMLHGIDREFTVECLGDWRCRSGYEVDTRISYLSGLIKHAMYIDEDTHTWEVGSDKYTMQLTLNFDNEMDEEE